MISIPIPTKELMQPPQKKKRPKKKNIHNGTHLFFFIHSFIKDLYIYEKPLPLQPKMNCTYRHIKKFIIYFTLNVT